MRYYSLDIKPYDPIRDTIKIEGTTYSGLLFRELGCNIPEMVGQVLRIDKKEDDLLTVTRLVEFEDTGRVLMPDALTAENGAKGALIGEFSESVTIRCSDCEGDDDCEICCGDGQFTINVPVEWTTIKAIYKMAVSILGSRFETKDSAKRHEHEARRPKNEESGRHHDQ